MKVDQTCVQAHVDVLKFNSFKINGCLCVTDLLKPLNYKQQNPK